MRMSVPVTQVEHVEGEIVDPSGLVITTHTSGGQVHILNASEAATILQPQAGTSNIIQTAMMHANAADVTSSGELVYYTVNMIN